METTVSMEQQAAELAQTYLTIARAMVKDHGQAALVIGREAVGLMVEALAKPLMTISGGDPRGPMLVAKTALFGAFAERYGQGEAFEEWARSAGLA